MTIYLSRYQPTTSITQHLMAGITILVSVYWTLKFHKPNLLDTIERNMLITKAPYWLVCATFTSFLSAALLSYVSYLYLQKNRHDNAHGHRISDPRTCRQVISGSFPHLREQSRLSPAQSRSRPNERLRIAFGIDNAFTRSDPESVGAFVKEAIQRVKLSLRDWERVGLVTRETVTNWMFNSRRNAPDESHVDSGRKVRVDLTALVQVLSLRAAVETMFDPQMRRDAQDEDFLKLAQAINRAWVVSKQQNANKQNITSFSENHSLRESLAALFHSPGEGAANNPLNWILPSFETLWRIVFCAFIEIRFKTGLDRPEWQRVMTAYAKLPSVSRFELRPVEDPLGSISHNPSRYSTFSTCPSAKDIVMECLRLYPPTRRIYRAFCSDGDSGCSFVAADIEACHLRTDIWGSDAETFNPRRWFALTKVQKEAFMPFGSRPFECPAKSVFGPRMIGILVGELVAALENEWANKMGWRLEDADGRILKIPAEARLKMDREAYQDLRLVDF